MQLQNQERVVPIQFEQTPTKTPTSPGFTAQPYQNTPPQYNRVQPPPFAPSGKFYQTVMKSKLFVNCMLISIGSVKLCNHV